MYQPGKQCGIWLADQLVYTVPGVMSLAVNSFTPADGIPSLAWTRYAARQISRERLQADERGGTVAYAVVDHDSVTKFEDSADQT